MGLEFLQGLGGEFGKMAELALSGLCPFCKKPVDHSKLKDACSIRENKISGLCQACQDETFGGDDE